MNLLNNLEQLLLEYSEKRNKKIYDAQKRKEELYKKNPRLQEIDTQMSMDALSTAKAILKTNNKNLLQDLKAKKSCLLKEKEEIYKALNIEPSCLFPQFDCTMCNDTGYITENHSTKMCNCLKQRIFDLEYNKLNSFDIRNCDFSNFSSDIYSDVPDKEKYSVSISPKANIEIIKKICNNFINNFDNSDEKNLLFTGNTGLGKTFLSNCIANELLKKNKTVLYQTAPIMLDSIISCRLRKIK